MSQNKTLEVVSIGDMEGSMNDVLMNLPMNTSSILNSVTTDHGEKGWFDVVIKMAP